MNMELKTTGRELQIKELTDRCGDTTDKCLITLHDTIKDSFITMEINTYDVRKFAHEILDDIGR